MSDVVKPPHLPMRAFRAMRKLPLENRQLRGRPVYSKAIFAVLDHRDFEKRAANVLVVGYLVVEEAETPHGTRPYRALYPNLTEAMAAYSDDATSDPRSPLAGMGPYDD